MINSETIVGIFDIDISTIEKRLRDYLTAAQKEQKIVDTAEDLPKSFIVTDDKVYISGLSSGILKQRCKQISW